MLTKHQRFHGHGSLRFLHKNAEVYRSHAMTLKVVSNPHRKQSRMAVIVSKKIHKSAVGRNRMRRRVYEILRREHPKFFHVNDIAVIITSAEVITMPHDELTQMLVGLLSQAGVLEVDEHA
jgi:ribonuclease P protein component